MKIHTDSNIGVIFLSSLSPADLLSYLGNAWIVGYYSLYRLASVGGINCFSIVDYLQELKHYWTLFQP